MQEFIFTLVVIFVLFRIFGNTRVHHFHHYQQPFEKQNKKPEGEISIDKVPPKSNNNRKSNNGEYVDYEEVK